jgi:hypothetical protein
MTQAYRCCEHAKEFQNDSKFFCREIFSRYFFAIYFPELICEFIRTSFASQTQLRCQRVHHLRRARQGGVDVMKSIHAVSCLLKLIIFGERFHRPQNDLRAPQPYCGMCFDCITCRNAA